MDSSVPLTTDSFGFWIFLKKRTLNFGICFAPFFDWIESNFIVQVWDLKDFSPKVLS